MVHAGQGSCGAANCCHRKLSEKRCGTKLALADREQSQGIQYFPVALRLPSLQLRDKTLHKQIFCISETLIFNMLAGS